VRRDKIGLSGYTALVSQLLMNTASFMVMPLLAVYLARHLGFSAAEVGSVLSANLLATRLLPSLTGSLADRFGARHLTTAGVWTRALGLTGFLIFQTPLPLTLCGVLIGLGSALYDPAVSSVFAAQPKSVRPRVFALHNLVLNLGVILGPAIGGLAALTSLRLPFLVSAAAFFLLGGVLLVLGRHFPKGHTAPLHQTYRRVLKNRAFMRLTLTSVLWWLVYAQLFVSFPLRAAQLSSNEASSSTLFIVNGVTGLMVIWGVMWLGNHVQSQHLIRSAYLIAMLAYAAVPLVSALWWLLVCVAVYTVAETLMLPSLEIAVAEYADGDASATYFGVFDVSWALGGSLGNYLGSFLILSEFTAVPWLVYAGVAGLGALATGIGGREHAPHSTLEDAL